MRVSSVQGGSVDPYRVRQATMGSNRSQTIMLCNMYIKTNLTFKLLLNDALDFSQNLCVTSCCVVPPLRRWSCEQTCNAPPVDARCVLIGRALLVMILNPFERVTVSLQHASMLHRCSFWCLRLFALFWCCREHMEKKINLRVFIKE